MKFKILIGTALASTALIAGCSENGSGGAVAVDCNDLPDLSAYDMDAAVRIIAGTARSMGVETEGV